MGDVVQFGKWPAKQPETRTLMTPSWFDDRFEYDPHWLTDALGMSDDGIARSLPMESSSDGCATPELPLQFAGTGERVPMIKPQQQPTESPSPLDSLAATIALLAANRKHLKGAVDTVSNFPTLLEDLALLVDEHVVIGLRTQWARRVAVPVLAAHRALHRTEGTEQERARVALDILRQCTDADIHNACSNWIRGKYHV